MLDSFYDNQRGALLYDCDSISPAGVIRTAEFRFWTTKFLQSG